MLLGHYTTTRFKIPFDVHILKIDRIIGQILSFSSMCELSYQIHDFFFVTKQPILVESLFD